MSWKRFLIAAKARLELEGQTGKTVVTEENFLPPAAKCTKRVGVREDAK